MLHITAKFQSRTPADVESRARCTHLHQCGPQCVETEGHYPITPHMYRCAGPSCPGLMWPASELAHPYQCTLAPERARCK